MKSTIITSWQELSLLENEWNALLRSSRSNTIFLTWEWIQSWREVVQEHLNPIVVTVRNERQQLVGIAPFYQYQLKLLDNLPYKGLRIMADYATASEYPDWIVSPECEDEALLAIASQLRQSRNLWDLIWMPRISGWNGAFDRITRALESVGLLYHSRQPAFSYFPLPETLEQFEADFSSKRRQQLRRNRRKLMSNPGVEVVFCRTSDELPNFIDSLFELHHQRRMLLGDPGCFIRKPAEAAFYKRFLPRALENGWLRLAALTQDGTIEAIQVGYAYNGDFLQMQEGFNPEYTNGAGNVLRHVVIEDCIKEGLCSYDFLAGYTEHKRRWKAEERLGHDLLIGRPSLKTRLLFLKNIWPTGRYLNECGLFDGNP
jgi:CelD/BcsL family acetyltransferase involved in cellulose biosynthesis